MKNIQNNNGKNKKTKKQKVQTHGQGLGRGLAGDMGLNFLFFLGFSMVFCSLAKTSRTQKKQKVQTNGQGLGYPHTNQKTKKPRNQKTKKPKKNKKNKIAHPKGRGSDAECWVLSFCFFLFFCFFCFLVCVWIAIADVPSRDCQALSVVALEARSINYSTAMFAMT